MCRIIRVSDTNIVSQVSIYSIHFVDYNKAFHVPLILCLLLYGLSTMSKLTFKYLFNGDIKICCLLIVLVLCNLDVNIGVKLLVSAFVTEVLKW